MLLILFQNSFAYISLDRSIVDFNQKNTIEDIVIVNRGKQVMYIDTQVVRVIHPDEPTEERQAVTRQQKSSLLISPKKMILKAGQRRKFRLISTNKNNQKEQIYRVSITPKIVNIPQQIENAKVLQSKVKILVGYNVLVMMRPKNFYAEVKHSRDGRQLHLQNIGNSNVLVHRMEYCEAGNCQPLPANRLYANESWDISLPGATGVVKSYHFFNGRHTAHQY